MLPKGFPEKTFCPKKELSSLRQNLPSELNLTLKFQAV